MELEFITVATDKTPGLQRLVGSARHFGFSPVIVGMGEKFAGYAWKFKRMLFAAEESRADLILFADGYDSLCLAPPSEILAKFCALGHPIVFSYEPDPRPEIYLHLNSGLIMAERGALLERFTDEVLADLFPDHFNDQLQLQTLMSWHEDWFHLDQESALFWTHSGVRALSEDFSACLVHGPHGADLFPIENRLRRQGITWLPEPLTPV